MVSKSSHMARLYPVGLHPAWQGMCNTCDVVRVVVTLRKDFRLVVAQVSTQLWH